MAAMVSLDLRKAFDTVNHRILLRKLELLGIRGNCYSWFSDYLRDRMQFVTVSDVKSSSLNINCGVLQGSILGPTLFLVYVNSISNLNLKGQINLYADDTMLVYFGDSVENVRGDILHDLNAIGGWLHAHKLTLNIDKSSFMLVDNKINADELPIIFENNTLKSTRVVKYLGLYIDETLSWEKHVTVLRERDC